MPTESTFTQPAPQRVHVAVYEHPHGTDIRVFADAGQAMCWRTGLAKEWWSNAFNDDPPPGDEIGEEYFERMMERDEFFSTVMCDVEVRPHPSTEPAPPGEI